MSIQKPSIKFSVLKQSWETSGYPGLVNEFVGPTIKMSNFRGALFQDNTSIPESGSISINSHFVDKTFGSPSEPDPEPEPEPGGSANVRVSLTDSFGDGWDDDGDGDVNTNNRLIIKDSGGNTVFNNTNTDVDGITEEPETITFDITLSAGEYDVEVTLAPGQEEFGEFAPDKSYSITLISDSSVLDSHDFSLEGAVPLEGSHISSINI